MSEGSQDKSFSGLDLSPSALRSDVALTSGRVNKLLSKWTCQFRPPALRHPTAWCR